MSNVNNAKGVAYELTLGKGLSPSGLLEYYRPEEKSPNSVYQSVTSIIGPTETSKILEYAQTATTAIMSRFAADGISANVTDVQSVAWTSLRDTETATGDHFAFTGVSDPNSDGDLGLRTSKGLAFISVKYGTELIPSLRNPGQKTLEKLFGVQDLDSWMARHQSTIFDLGKTQIERHDAFKKLSAAKDRRANRIRETGYEARVDIANALVRSAQKMSSEQIRDILVELIAPKTVYPHYRIHTVDRAGEAEHRISQAREHVEKIFSEYVNFHVDHNTIGKAVIGFKAFNKFHETDDIIATLHIKFTSGPCSGWKGSFRAPCLHRRKKKRIIHLFDLDDTLFHYGEDGALTHVHDIDGLVASLTPAEYGEYRLKPGEFFDYTEFEDATIFRLSARPIKKLHDKLKTLQSKDATIAIVTARNHFKSMEDFEQALAQHGIEVPLHMAGSRGEVSTSSARKKLVFLDMLREWQYDEMYLYDDSIHNIEAFLSLSWDYPDVKFVAYHVTHDAKRDKTKMKKMVP